MGARYDRLKGHVAEQYERRGRGRERADRLDGLAPAPPASSSQPAVSEEAPPAPSTSEEPADDV